MPTHAEYAKMCSIAYTPEEADVFFDATGWQWCHGTQEASWIDAGRGLAYALFRYDANQEIVIAFRGTDNVDNYITDFWMAFGYGPNTYAAAETAISTFLLGPVAEQWQHYTISFTGHSLGGTLATQCAIYFNKAAVVFESASIPRTFPIPQEYDRQQILTFVTAPDAVNTLNPHIGEVRRLMLRPIATVSSVHAIASLWGTASRATLLVIALDYLYNKYFGPEAHEQEAAPGVGAVSAWFISRFLGSSPTIEKYVPLLPKFLAATALLSALLGAAPGFSEDYDWLFNRHHKMAHIIDAIDPTRGQVNIPQVQSWPSFWQHWLINRPAYEISGFVPLLPSNRGLHTLFRENRVIEAQVEHMVGYRLME